MRQGKREQGERKRGHCRWCKTLFNPVKVNRWGWESKMRRKGRQGEWVLLTGLLKVTRRRSLVFSLSLCLVLSLRRLILSSLALSPSPSFPQPSRKLKHYLLCAKWGKKKKNACEKKKGGSEYKTMLGTDLTTCREISPSFWRDSVCSEGGIQSGEPQLTENVNVHSAGRESRLLLPFSHFPHLLLCLHFALFHFDLSIHGLCVCERERGGGSWQVAVCKGIEAYEIFTKAIMTPWTERVEEVGEERRGGKRARGEK